MENAMEMIRQQAEEALIKLEAQGIVTAAHVADSILRQAAYWEKPLTNGEKLLFVRLFSPVVQREEVFLGNILFNVFLSKAFARAVTNGSFGRAELMANDLQSCYFLVRAGSELNQLASAFYVEVERGLPDIFFGQQDEAKGIYGELSRMFTFRKSDFEPFPVYAVPQYLAPQLEKAVRRELSTLMAPTVFPNRVRTVLAAIAFFYGRTSGGSGDAQSFPNFVDHLVNDEEYDGLLRAEDVKRVFNIADAEKPQIKQSLDNETYSVEELRLLLSDLLQAFHVSIDAGSTKWLMGFLHKDNKFVGLSPTDYLNVVLADTQLGYRLFSKSLVGDTVPCRICNAAPALIEERYVTTGLNSFKFHNQSIRNQSEKACVKCALNSFLAQKLLGTEMVSTGGKLPQVPKTYNLIFHYGQHSDEEINQLVRRTDLIWSLVRKHREADQVRREVASQVRELKAKHDRELKAKRKQALATELAEKEEIMQQAQADVTKVESDIFAVCPWLKESGASPAPTENCSLDVLANIQLSESKVEQHILGLGMGGYRMVFFVLPQIRAPRDAKEHDFAQRRFSDSRITVTALLSFLREVCGCDGPFYYQSLPTLTPDAFQLDTFYIRNEPISLKQAQDEYEVVTQLAWKLVKRRKPTESGQEVFTRKVLLAEQLLADPLGRFSAVMRDSPILGVKQDPKKQQFKRLPGGWRGDWKAQDLTEYAKFIQRLSKLQEVK